MSAPAADAKLSAFIEACLDPLPDDVLIDTHYNLMVRYQRWDAWRAADAKTRCYNALFEAAGLIRENARYRVHAPVSIPPESECLKLYRQALAEQLLTPVERKADIDWKKRKFKSESREGYWCLPVEPEEIEASIAADEAFLAAHPTKRTHRRTDR
jgi:hypothetical protein